MDLKISVFAGRRKKVQFRQPEGGGAEIAKRSCMLHVGREQYFFPSNRLGKVTVPVTFCPTERRKRRRGRTHKKKAKRVINKE
jgi:hypothetical protein